MLYPELKRKFGSAVTYWDNPAAHIRTEFGFDVLQVASGRYAPESYRRFIGFQVSRDVLERAFQDTYRIEMKDVFGNLSLALGSYRHTVGFIVPGMTRVAWNLKKDQLQKEIPGVTCKKFLYNLSRSSYEKEWGTEYRKPGLGTRLLTLVFRIVPTSGPFRALKIRTSTPEVEKLFMASFNASVDRYKFCSRKWTPAGLSCRTRISTPAEQPSPASTKEPMRRTQGCWGSWRTVSSPR